MTAVARANPEAGFANGQAVFALVRYGRLREALELARACRAARWWCLMLEGHAQKSVGLLGEAEATYRAAVLEAPAEVTCVAGDGTRLLGSWHPLGRAGRAGWSRLRDLSCEDRNERSRRIWWLADPLYSVDGNDRWLEHADRALQAQLVTDLSGHIRRVRWRWLQLEEWFWSSYLRRGLPDSWYREPGNNPWFSSRRVAHYHFVPDFEDGDLSRPVWRLEADLADEGYTPPYGTFHELSRQIARFRTRDGGLDSMRVALAGTLARTELADATGAEPHLVLSDGPGSFPLHVTSTFEEQRTAFLAHAPTERFVLSYEVLSEGRFGRHRQLLDPLETDGPGLSDLLLYRPEGEEPPEALDAATELMLGETAMTEGDELGIFWETYGAEAGTPVQVELEVEGGGGGLFGWIGGLFGGGGDRPARLAWTEPSPGAVAPRGVALGLAGLDAGSYTLVLRTSWPGQQPLEARRSFEVRSPGG